MNLAPFCPGQIVKKSNRGALEGRSRLCPPRSIHHFILFSFPAKPELEATMEKDTGVHVQLSFENAGRRVGLSVQPVPGTTPRNESVSQTLGLFGCKNVHQTHLPFEAF